MKILMLSTTFPYPPSRGGTQIRTFNLLKHLSARHAITLVTFEAPDVTPAEVDALGEWAEVKIFPRPQPPSSGSLPKLVRFAHFMLDGTPPHVRSIDSRQVQTWIDRRIATGQYDVLTCEHSINEVYVRPQWRQQLRTIVNIHSSVYGSCKHQLHTQTSEHIWRDRMSLPLLRRYEQHYCRKFSHLVVTTTDDANQLQHLYPDGSVTVIPNGVDLELFPYRSGDPGGHHLIFMGAMDNIANIDAARFLGLEVFPALRKRYPDATLAVVGARPVPAVEALQQMDGITVTGQVPVMADYLHQATVCVIPMRTGLGIKNKTLEAMASGVPVVASDRGLEGLAIGGASPLCALRANQTDEYVDAIAHLFEDAHLRSRLSIAARQMVEQHYTWAQAGTRYESLIAGA